MKGKNILCRFGHLGFVIKFVSLLVLACASGCSQRELCYDHSHASPVTVIFDWSKAPEAAPETMVVWFFSVDTDESYRFELTDGQGQESRSGFDCKIKVRQAPTACCAITAAPNTSLSKDRIPTITGL